MMRIRLALLIACLDQHEWANAFERSDNGMVMPCCFYTGSPMTQ